MCGMSGAVIKNEFIYSENSKARQYFDWKNDDEGISSDNDAGKASKRRALQYYGHKVFQILSFFKIVS